MKKIVSNEKNFCDACGKETYPHKCIGCGIEYCYECITRHLKELKWSVHFGGSGDAYICSKCLANPPEKIKTLLSAYLTIVNMRAEYTTWWKEFDARASLAEAHCKKEIEKYESRYGRI